MAMREYPLGTSLGIQVLSDQWFGLILLNVGDDQITLKDLCARVNGISTSAMLAKASKLSGLGLVTLDMDYRIRITQLGRDMQATLIRLNQWGDELMTAQLVRKEA